MICEVAKDVVRKRKQCNSFIVSLFHAFDKGPFHQEISKQSTQEV